MLCIWNLDEVYNFLGKYKGSKLTWKKLEKLEQINVHGRKRNNYQWAKSLLRPGPGGITFWVAGEDEAPGGGKEGVSLGSWMESLTPALSSLTVRLLSCSPHEPGDSVPGFRLCWPPLVAQNPPAMQETRVWSLGQEDPWRRAWQPTPVFLPWEVHGQRSLAGCSPRGHKWLTYSHTHTSLFSLS